MVVGSGPSSASTFPLLRYHLTSNLIRIFRQTGADIVQELGTLALIKSSLAAKKVYRSIRTPPRYDIGLETGWRDHIETVVPMKLLSAPSTESLNGRIVLADDTVLDDVDVGFRFLLLLPQYFMGVANLYLNPRRSSSLRRRS